MTAAIISMWFLIPVTVVIATAIAVRFDGRVRTGALIALGVAALQGVVTVAVSSDPDADMKILVVSSLFAGFGGFFHRELIGQASGWVEKHAMKIWGGSALIITVVVAPELAKGLLTLAFMAFGFRVMFTGFFPKKKDEKSSHK